MDWQELDRSFILLLLQQCVVILGVVLLTCLVLHRPRNFTVMALDESLVRMTWKPHQNASMTHYVAVWCKGDASADCLVWHWLSLMNYQHLNHICVCSSNRQSNNGNLKQRKDRVRITLDQWTYPIQLANYSSWVLRPGNNNIACTFLAQSYCILS